MTNTSAEHSRQIEITIVEVIRRAENGMTRPFICHGSDGERYFVKGRGAGRRSQICEWVAGNLGRELGLPIAPFTLVNVPEALLKGPEELELNDLGAGPAFGSRAEEIMELSASMIDEIPVSQQQDVLLFDWWIHNGDRNLTEKGGNPNLFWEPEQKKLVVFDHNQAFDDAFDAEYFVNYHAFRRQVEAVFGDMAMRQEYNAKFNQVLGRWREICSGIPDQWFWADPEMSVPVDLDLDAVLTILKRHETKTFWKRP